MLYDDMYHRIWSPMSGAYLEPCYALAQLACIRACGNNTTARRVYARLYRERFSRRIAWYDAMIAGDENCEILVNCDGGCIHVNAYECWLNQPRYTTRDVADILR